MRLSLSSLPSLSLLRAVPPLLAALGAAALVARPARAQYEGPRAEVETFVAPTGGPIRLTGLSMNTFSFFTPAVAGIYAWDGTDLSGPSLFRAVLGPRLAPGISLTPDLPLTPGATYAFALFPGVGAYSFSLAQGDLVQGGQAYRCLSTAGCTSFQELSGDPASRPRHFVGFTATFTADAVTTPEPATLALTAGGLIGLAAAATRRRRPAR